MDILSIFEAGLRGKTDKDILQFSHSSGRVVLTHDSDFGKLFLFEEQPFIGVIFIRPLDTLSQNLPYRP